jgi:hypothetical protein
MGRRHPLSDDASPLLTPSGGFDRGAIMRKAWRDFRRVRVLRPGSETTGCAYLGGQG